MNWKISEKSLNDFVEMAKNVAELKAERDKYEELWKREKELNNILMEKFSPKKGEVVKE